MTDEIIQSPTYLRSAHDAALPSPDPKLAESQLKLKVGKYFLGLIWERRVGPQANYAAADARRFIGSNPADFRPIRTVLK